MRTEAQSTARLGSVAQHPTIERAVTAVRDLLGMDLAYTAQLDEREQTFDVMVGDPASFGVAPGASMPRDETYCARVLGRELPNIIGDVRAHPVAGAMAITRAAKVGAFASVPLERSDGSLWGTMCCASHAPRPALAEQELNFMRVLARVVVDQIERDELEQRLGVVRRRAAAASVLATAVDARDAYTAEHSRSVVELAVRVAQRLGLGTEQVDDVAHAALLHDIGKLAIPDSMLLKDGPLDDEEWALMRTHPARGAAMLAAIPELADLVPVVRAEHEHWDGEGYPDGLTGEEIPLAARIVLVCDGFHAMTSDRPYRAAMAADEAVAELRRCAGTQYDPSCVQALLTAL